LDQKLIESWFNKQSHADHFRDNIRTNVTASGISLERIAKMDDDTRSLYEKV